MRAIAAVQTVRRMPIRSCLGQLRGFIVSLNQMEGVDDQVDDLDADERRDDAAEAVDQEIAAEQRGRSNGAEAHTTKCQWHQRDDDERVEDDGTEDRAVGRL